MSESFVPLDIGKWPNGYEQWKETVAFIQANLKGIQAICNVQAGPNPMEYMPHDKAVLFWYAHLADHILKQGEKLMLQEPQPEAIDV